MKTAQTIRTMIGVGKNDDKIRLDTSTIPTHTTDYCLRILAIYFQDHDLTYLVVNIILQETKLFKNLVQLQSLNSLA
jgi:hypothetical protein